MVGGRKPLEHMEGTGDVPGEVETLLQTIVSLEAGF